MGNILNFESFETLKESNDKFSNEFDSLTEGIMDAVKSPLKFRKIKKNAKALQKELVTKALLDLEYQKKIKGKSVEQKGTLKAATDAKKKAGDERISGLNQAMDDASTTDGLKSVAAMAKTKAKLGAAKISLKSATASETKAIKQQMKKLTKKAQEESAELKRLAAVGKSKEDSDSKAAKDKEAADAKAAKDKEAEPDTGKNSKADKIDRYKKLLADTEDEEKKKKFQDKIDSLQKESEERFLDPDFIALVESELNEYESL
jgi:hypothetical protein